MNAADFNTLTVPASTENTIAAARIAQEVAGDNKATRANGAAKLDEVRAEVAAVNEALAGSPALAGSVALIVREGKLSALDDAFTKLARRANRLGLSAPSVTVSRYFGAFFVQRLEGGDAMTVFSGFAVVVVLGSELKLPGGWKLAAVIDHTVSSDGNMIRNVPGCDVAIPEEYRTAAPTCDHCGTVRQRNETFVLANDEGKIVRVGRSCIRDFLGHGSPENVAQRAIWAGELSALVSEDWEDFGGYRAPFGTPIVKFLLACAALVKVDGWLSRGNALYDDATADRAMRVCFDSVGTRWARTPDGNKIRRAIEDENGETIETLANGSLEWARTQDGTSDYCHNLRLACSEDTVTSKTAGIVASAIPCYMRELDRQAERRLASTIKGNEWIAQPGDKFGRKLTKKDREKGATAHPAIEGTVLRFNFLDNEWGCTTIVTVVTDNGQIVKWFASNYDPENDGIERGSKVSVVATVKKLSEWKGQKETVLTRCVVSPRD